MKSKEVESIPSSIFCVILSFNLRERTSRCLESALTVFRPEQVILVHNGSLPIHVAHLKGIYPHIRHLEYLENQGFVGGANFGIQYAVSLGGHGILFLTNDTELVAFQTPSNIEMPLIWAPLVTKRGLEKTDSFGGKVDLFRGKIRHLKKLDSNVPLDFVPGSGFFITSSAWKHLGGFDSRFFCYWEDVDLGFRAKKLGIGLKQTAAIHLKHDISKTTGKKPYYTFYLYQRNRYLFIKTHGKLFHRAVFALLWFYERMTKHFKFWWREDKVRLQFSKKILFPQVTLLESQIP